MTLTNSFSNLKNKVIVIDVKGAICTEERTFDWPLAKLLPQAQEALQKLKDINNTIILWTARGWEQFKITKKWLGDHGFVYDQILMGKPMVDCFIDDRARQFKGWDTLHV